MAEDEKNQSAEGGTQDVEEAMSEVSEDTLKVPDEAEAEPANVEGSDAQLP